MEKICIPLDIIRNFNLSPRARIVWAELSVLPRNENGEFVVKTKEFAKQLGICDSTLRRALKILLEQKLIEFVGLDEKRCKRFKLSSIVIASEARQSKVEAINAIQAKAALFKELVDKIEKKKLEEETKQKEKIEFEEKEALRKEEERQRKEALPREKIHLKEGEFLKVCYKLQKPLTLAQQESLKYFKNYNASSFASQFPRLNGLDGYPLLNDALIMYVLILAADENNEDCPMGYFIWDHLEEFSKKPMTELAPDMMIDRPY